MAACMQKFGMLHSARSSLPLTSPARPFHIVHGKRGRNVTCNVAVRGCPCRLTFEKADRRYKFLKGCLKWQSSSTTTLKQRALPTTAQGPQSFDDNSDDEDEWEEYVEGEEDDLAIEMDDEMDREATEAAISYQENVLAEAFTDEDDTPRESRKEKRGRRLRDNEWEVPEKRLPKVAIVGRPNVGKSAIFNRIVGREVAIVYDEPGVTRDRLYLRAFWERHEFKVIDTGGVITPPLAAASASPAAVLDGIAVTQGGGAAAVTQAMREAAQAGLPAMIELQAAQAVAEAAAVILVVDGQTGPTAADMDIAKWLRRRHPGKPVTLAVNKCESPTKGLLQAAEFWSLGLTPIAVSAISGARISDMLEDACSHLPTVEDILAEVENSGSAGVTIGADGEGGDGTPGKPLAIAIVGRPNVGKSSILNALVGEARTIVSPVSGTTRDAIDSDFTGPDGTAYRLVDTAGIRRRAAVASAGSKAEALSVNRAFRAIRRADVVALVIDAMAFSTEQDFRLGERIEREGKACVIVVNKWDTVPDKTATSTVIYDADLRERLRCLDWAPTVYISATTGQRVPRLLEVAKGAALERCKRLSTATLNTTVREAVAFKGVPMGKGGKKGRIYYCTQAAIRPPIFVFFVNDAKLFPEGYRRYMEKQIRENVGYPGTPIRLLWRSKKKVERTERIEENAMKEARAKAMPMAKK